MSKNKRKISFPIILSVLFVAVAALLFIQLRSNSQPAPLDNFAQCLTDSGATMYGAYWCHNCTTQKEAFGRSWKHVDYIECAAQGLQGQLKICEDANIEAYPTWKFEDGSSLTGTQTFAKLSQKTNCELPENYQSST